MSKNPLMLEKRAVEGTQSRPKRVPVNSLTRNVLNVQGIKSGMHACWVGERELDKYLLAGYEPVTYDVIIGDRGRLSAVASSLLPGGSVISLNTGLDHVSYLLQIPEEWHKEDMALAAKDADSLEETMYEHADKAGLSGTLKINGSIER